jgi:hypothetical protein
MAFDLLVKNATLPDGRRGQDIGVTGDRITAEGSNLAAGRPARLDPAAYAPQGRVAARYTIKAAPRRPWHWTSGLLHLYVTSWRWSPREH